MKTEMQRYLFGKLTAADWATARRVVATLPAGDEGAMRVSIGFVDVGKSPGGLGYVGRLDRDGKHHKLYLPNWPKS